MNREDLPTDQRKALSKQYGPGWGTINHDDLTDTWRGKLSGGDWINLDVKGSATNEQATAALILIALESLS